MRTVLMLLVLTGALLIAVWLGGETLLARSVVRMIADDPRLEAASVTELREGSRMGLGFTDVAFDDPKGRIALPSLTLWVPPQRPNEVHASLPQQAVIEVAGRAMTLGAERAELIARFSPTRGFTLWKAAIDAAGVTLDGAPLAERIDATAYLAGFGHDAPEGAGAAYDIQGVLTGLALPALTAGAAEGVAGAQGKGRVWLTQPMGRTAEGTEPPRLVGLRADGVTLSLDDLSATLRGRVIEDDAGLATGEMVVDTADADAILGRVAAMGAMPPLAVPLMGALLAGLSATPPPGTAAAAPAQPVREGTAEAVAKRALERAQTLPPPPEGQTRLTFSFRDGKTWIGAAPIGPAPRLR